MTEHEQLMRKMQTVVSLDLKRLRLRDDYRFAKKRLDAQRDALKADIHAATPEAQEAARREVEEVKEDG